MARRTRGLGASLFLFLWSAIVAWFLVDAFVNGEFRYGRRPGVMIRPDTHPYFYWIFLSFWLVMSLVAAYFGYRELRWWREQQKAQRTSDDHPRR
jgi:purine-cytosine permease-like protein